MTPRNVTSISAHRAFIYGLCAPGMGETYAGSRLRGYLTALFFIFFGTWFGWTVFTIVEGTVERIVGRLEGISPVTPQDLSLLSLGISFIGIYCIWLWSQISSVDSAIEIRRKNKEPSQASVAWSITISWFCPGAGQVYAGDRRLGYILFTGYIMGILLMIPAYIQLFQGMTAIVKSDQLSLGNPYTLINMVREQITRMDYSYGKLFQLSLKSFAVAAGLATLRLGPLSNDVRWTQPALGAGAALFGIGWLCPGAGQILQKRSTFGWCLLAGYLGSSILIGFLLSQNFITVQKVDTLAWVGVLFQWGAMAEAPLQMLRMK